MRTSKFLLATVKEDPADVEIASHRLMIRAGMVRQVAAGIYDWLPLGYRVLKKVENIVRREMDSTGAQEVLLPGVQPAELWRESGRWDDFGPELLRFKDRHGRDFCLGPTHEEVITTLVRGEIRSYRQLPANLYQIQWKFRDEVRPRFGVMRGREFLMKDAYSFDVDERGMQQSYQVMYDTYSRIFARLGLESRAVEADPGAIGGNYSHEFHVLAESGEDAIAICEEGGYAANVELVPIASPAKQRPEPTQPMVAVDTPGAYTIEAVCGLLSLEPEQSIKTLMVQGGDGPVALVMRGDHELNTLKAEKLPQVKTPIQFASVEEVRRATGTDPGCIGPVNLDVPVIADHSAFVLANFVCGANQPDKHLRGVNWRRDLPEPGVADLRKAVDGDPCPDGTGNRLTIRRGIEVGHVFQLGTKYSEAMGANCLDTTGKSMPMHMGCYGIGVSRIVAAAIEQNHDENGIIWPDAIAPFDVCIIPIGFARSHAVNEASERLYASLRDSGFDVLLDDRNERPGVMFNEMDLIGIPHRIVVGERGLKRGIVEYRHRRDGISQDIPLDTMVQTLRELSPTRYVSSV